MLLLLSLLGCPDTKDDTAPADDTAVTDDTATDDTGFPATCEDVDGDAATGPDALACAEAGGVCVATMDQCVGGVAFPDGDAGCAFDDGPGYCCIPPEPAATGDTCEEQGGVCAPIAGCGMVHGWFTPNLSECSDAWWVGVVCCAPADSCEGWGTVTCCANDGNTAYVASCDRGDLTCAIDDTTLTCEQDCAAF